MPLPIPEEIRRAVSEANDSDAGLASGMVTTAQQVGGALGLAVLVSVATGRASSLVRSGHSPATAQLAGSFLVGARPQVTEHEGTPVLVRQAAQLLVEALGRSALLLVDPQHRDPLADLEPGRTTGRHKTRTIRRFVSLSD